MISFEENLFVNPKDDWDLGDLLDSKQSWILLYQN
eukprot:03717.XXX_34314_34945_1 [CDS] Oithona nana genome sequencing.